MPHTKMRLIFMGTPDFAVPSLELLLSHGYEVVAVVTAPDKPQGRGQRVGFSPVKQSALAHNIPVLQPTNLKDPVFLATLEAHQADLQIVVAFRMLPKVVWAMPPLGTFNLHASLLPKYRGAAPINWAIINGEQETGVSTFFLEETIDTGNILFQEREPIDAQDTAGTLYGRLRQKGAHLVLKTVGAIVKGAYTMTPQVVTVEDLAKKAPKLYKEDCCIDWNQEAPAIVNFVRGLAPHPAAWTILQGKTCKLLAVEEAQNSHDLTPGEVYSDGKAFMLVGTQSSPVAIRTLQPAGRKVMQIQDFLRGHQL